MKLINEWMKNEIYWKRWRSWIIKRVGGDEIRETVELLENPEKTGYDHQNKT